MSALSETWTNSPSCSTDSISSVPKTACAMACESLAAMGKVRRVPSGGWVR